MSFSSRRRNYLLTPHRRDGLIEWYVKRYRSLVVVVVSLLCTVATVLYTNTSIRIHFVLYTFLYTG